MDYNKVLESLKKNSSYGAYTEVTAGQYIRDNNGNVVTDESTDVGKYNNVLRKIVYANVQASTEDADKIGHTKPLSMKNTPITDRNSEGQTYYNDWVELYMFSAVQGDTTVDAALKDKILVIGENIKIRRFVRYEGICSAYIHAGGTHAVLVNFETTPEVAANPAFAAYGHDVAMQIAAANPGYLCESEVPAEVLDKEKEILLAQIANDPKNANKPDAIKEKMVMGRIGKFYKENCLVDQEFVKDPELTIAKYTDKVAKELGGDIKIVKFVRYEKGEGLEKRVDDFASEVAGMVK